MNPMTLCNQYTKMQLAERCVDLEVEHERLVRWIREELKCQIDGMTSFCDACCTNPKERDKVYQSLSDETHKRIVE